MHRKDLGRLRTWLQLEGGAKTGPYPLWVKSHIFHKVVQRHMYAHLRCGRIFTNLLLHYGECCGKRICTISHYCFALMAVRSIVISVFVCLSVCMNVRLFVCVSAGISQRTTRPNFTKFSVHVTYGRRSVLLWPSDGNVVAYVIYMKLIHHESRIQSHKANKKKIK